MLPDLSGREGTHPRLPSSSCSFLPRLALRRRASRTEATDRRGAVPSHAPPSFPQTQPCSYRGGPFASWKTYWHMTVVLSPWAASQLVRPTSPSPPGITGGESPAPGSWHFLMGFPGLTSCLFHTRFGSKPGA